MPPKSLFLAVLVLAFTLGAERVLRVACDPVGDEGFMLRAVVEAEVFGMEAGEKGGDGFGGGGGGSRVVGHAEGHLARAVRRVDGVECCWLIGRAKKRPLVMPGFALGQEWVGLTLVGARWPTVSRTPETNPAL